MTRAAGPDAGRAASTRVAKVFVIFVAVVVLYSAWSWWFSDQRAIRHQLAAIAAALTVRPGEGDLGPVTRAAALRKALAPDVRVSAGGQEIVSRDAVLGLATRWSAPAGGLTVEFDDVQVTVHDDRESADVYCTAKLTGASPQGGEPTVDAREVTVGFVKLDGDWVVSSAKTQDTLAR